MMLNEKTMAKVLTLMLLIIFASAYKSNNCFTGCKACEILFHYVFCVQCDPDRYYDFQTGRCNCLAGTFDNGAQCAACPYSCLSCNQYYCTSCSNDKYLSNEGLCLCSNGEGFDAQGNCQSTVINIRMILGISIGLCLGCCCIVSLVCCVIRKRRNLRLFFNGQDRNIEGEREENNEHQPNPVQLQIQSAMGFIEGKKHRKYAYKQEFCSICLQNMPFFMTQCGHFFHQPCITEWIKKRNICPNCNQIVCPLKIMKWCNKCKKQLIFPQRYRVISHVYPMARQLIPIFWQTCPNCQVIQQQIDLDMIK